MIRMIAAGMNAEGIFVLSEKVEDDDPDIERLFVDLHHEEKKRNAYTESEIARKRKAIEDVLVPESLGSHEARLKGAGFGHVGVWLRHFNFVSLVAIR
jgi:tRNA (cmo5U34)-methyltransferase